MSLSDYKPKKIFTVEQANATLPLVRAIVTDLAKLSKDVMERRQRLSHIATDRTFSSGDPYDDELAEIERDLEADTAKLQEYVRELQDLGVEPKGAIDGLADFPCVMDGRLVFLCWKIGEREILHWHELDGGFSGRQSLTVDSIADDVGDQSAMFD